MKFIKFILLLLALGAGIYVLFWLFGIFASFLWYAFWIGLIALGGYAGYKLFLGKEKETPQLEEKTPIGISEMKDADRALEEYKRKYLPK